MAMKNPPHPGQGLKADLDELRLTTAQAAQALGVSRAQLHRVLSGTSAMSAELALRLEIVVGGTAEGWLRMQAAFDAAHVRERTAEIAKGLRRIAAPSLAPSEPPRVS